MKCSELRFNYRFEENKLKEIKLKEIYISEIQSCVFISFAANHLKSNC